MADRRALGERRHEKRICTDAQFERAGPHGCATRGDWRSHSEGYATLRAAVSLSPATTTDFRAISVVPRRPISLHCLARGDGRQASPYRHRPAAREMLDN